MPSEENRAQRVILAVWFALASLLSKSVASVVTLPLCLHYLGEEKTGLWLLVQTFTSYLPWMELGLGQIAMNASGKAYAKGEQQEVSKILTTSLFLLVFVGIAVTGLGMALLSFFPVESWLVQGSFSNQKEFRELLFIVVPLSLARLPAVAFLGVISGLRDYHIRTFLDMLHALANILVIVLVLGLGGQLRSLVWATSTVALAISSLVFLVAKYRHPLLRLNANLYDRSLCRRLVKEMGSFAPVPLSLSIQRGAPLFLVSRFVAVGEVPKIYLLVVAFRVFLFSVLDALSRSLQPYMIAFDATDDQQRKRFFWTLSTRLGSGFSAMLLPLVVISYSWFAAVLAGTAAVPEPLAIFLTGALFFVEASLGPGVNFSLALGQFGGLSRIWVMNAAVCVLLGWIGSQQPWIDPISGVCAGFLAGHLLIAVPLQCSLFGRVIGMGALRYFVAAVGKVGAGLGAVLLIAYGGLPRVGPENWEKILVAVALSAAVAIGWAFQLGSEEKTWLIQRARQWSRAF